MRPSIILIAAMLLATGCGDRGDTPPSAYRHSRDRIIAALGGRVFGQQPCFRTIKGWPGRLSDGDCYRTGKPRLMRGVWITGFEESIFYPGLTSPPPDAMPSSAIWLDVEPAIRSPELRRHLQGCGGGCYIHLEFIGRRTSVTGHYGHMGMSDHVIVVDRLIAAKLLGGH